MTEASATATTPGARPRTHQVPLDVTAVLVTRGVTEYLATTLAALAAQTRSPQRVLVVDAAHDAHGGQAASGSHDDPDRHHDHGQNGQDAHDAQDRHDTELADLLTTTAASGLSLVLAAVPDARTFGDAVRRALTALDHGVLTGPATGAPADGPGRWLWLLHDDSAPAPTALAELLRAVEVAPSVAVAGCKQRSWADPVRVIEAGLTTSRFGRRMTGIDEPEVDQGQHDGREDVLAVGLAGALVRRDVWDELDGPDPALGPYGDGLDLCRRARLAGHRVVVVPQAVVRHAQASLAMPIGGAVVNRPGWDVRRSVQARREAYLHAQLSGVPALLVPAVVLLALVSGVARALGRFVTKEPHLVVAELTAPLAVLGRPDRIVRARRRAARTGRLTRRSLRPLQVTWRDVVGQASDRRLTAAERRRHRQAPSELELTELAALRTRRRGTLAVVLLAASAVTALAVGPLITRVMAGGRLTGGTLTFGDATAGDLWSGLTSGWVPGGLGAPGPTEPLLIALLPLTAAVATLGSAAAVVLLAALVAAAAGAWFAAGAATRSVTLRAWAALVWVAAPSLLLGLGEARLGAVLAHVMLPWVVLGVARAVGVARVDVVESGLVGARRTGGPAVRERDAVPPVVRAAEPSLAAAAGAGLAFAVLTAAAPVLLPFGLLALLVVAASAHRRRRLAWVAVPAVALHGPMVVEALTTWSDGGWRLLVADPGVPLASSPAPAWQQLLGWPTVPPEWVDLPGRVAVLLPLAATGAVVLVALCALALPGPTARGVRAAWLVAACGLAAAIVSARVEVGLAADDELGRVLATGWPGAGVSLALAGLLAAGLVGAGGFRGATAGRSFGWRQVGAGVVALLALLGPAVVLGGWTWHVREARDVALVVETVPVVPAVGTQLQRSAEDVRVLELEVDGDGEVAATLLRHDGVQLADLSRAAEVREVEGPYGRAAPVEPDAARSELAEAAARLASGSSDDVAVALADLGVGAVLVPPVAAGEDEAAATGARSVVVGRIDSTLGLERVTETASGVIWRVAVTDLGGTTAWARLVESAGVTEDALIAALPSDDGRLTTTLESAAPGQGNRVLVLAENADPGWKAVLDGQQLRAVGTSWRQAFEVGPDGGDLTVRYAAPGRTPWLVLQGLVLLVTLLLALPVRRRRAVAR
ncbi:MAG: glycosyl transferase family 2 [Actinotalea sp.]|nr:glycosyl transferase family 2 [Actinotalea sp.]